MNRLDNNGYSVIDLTSYIRLGSHAASEDAVAQAPPQKGKHLTPSASDPSPHTDHSAQMLGWVLLLLACLLWGSVGAWVGYRHGFERGVRDHVAAFEEQTR